MAGARGIIENMNQMKIEYLPVSSLHPYERNAKQHTDEQVEHIANSIREFGFRQPIVVDADNVVVIGHGRRGRGCGQGPGGQDGDAGGADRGAEGEGEESGKGGGAVCPLSEF